MIVLQAEDRQRIAISWALSIGITIAMLGLFFFIRMSSHLPKVEPLELFVEVNYGTSKVGKGDIQTFNKPNDSKVAENMKADADEVKKVKSVANPKPTPPTPPKVESTTKPTKVVAEKPVIASKVESPVEAPEKVDVKKTNGSATSSAPVTKPAPEKAVNKDALFTKSSGSKSGSNGTNGTKTGVGGNNNGDDADGVGDKGAKTGSLFAKTYKGEGGGGGTAVGLSLSGWGMSRRPVVDDKSDVTGDITFKITVDKNGRVKSIVTQNTTVTDYAVVNKYKSAVRDLTFVPKSANVPDESTGTITFKIRSQ